LYLLFRSKITTTTIPKIVTNSGNIDIMKLGLLLYLKIWTSLFAINKLNTTIPNIKAYKLASGNDPNN